MLRAGPVCPILPNPAFGEARLPQPRVGFLKLARLKALNMSAWNRNLNRSVSRNCLRIEKSQRYKLGPVTLPTPLLPRRPSGAAANAAGLIHPLGPGFASSTDPPT